MKKHNIKTNDLEFSIFKDKKVWGDGTHETHKYLMDLICKYGVKDKSVIDIGTGTGILSVLCGKLGASHILALDIDTHSLEWARKNFKRNGVEAETEVNDITNYLDNKADVIIANLPCAVQVENLKHVRKNLNDNGLLIVSWWNELNFETYANGFEVIEHIPGNEYDAYVLKGK